MIPFTRVTLVAALAMGVAFLPGEARPHSPGETAAATLVTEPETPRAGERTALAFTLSDGAGAPLQDLVTHHGRKLHVIIVSEDMQVLGHVHPRGLGEQTEAGEAKMFFTFPRPGRYLVAADFMTAAGPHAEQFTVEVAGSGATAVSETGAAAHPTIAIVTLEDDDRYTDAVLLQDTGEAGGYGVALQKPDVIEAGEPVTLIYRFTMDGAPLTDLRPYLDAPMHLAVVSNDLSHFLHEHGMLPGKAHAGHGDGSHHAHASDNDPSGDSHHGHHGYQGPAVFGPEITASFSFPEPGTYYLFSQTAHGDTLLISRIPVEVE